MGLLSRRKNQGESAPAGAPRAVLAAAVPLSGPGVRAMESSRKASGAEAWQKDAWYFYDSVGEFRAPVQWIANVISKADVYAAEVDPESGRTTGPTDNAQAQAAASMAFGGHAHRAQLQETLAIHWQVPGESFVVIRPRPDRDGVRQPDEWLVLSGEEITPKGGRWQYSDPSTMVPVMLGPSDRLIRVWKPHPRRQAFPDSAARAALVPLREIEKASQNLAARLDSRLSGNGLLLLPQEMDFPQGDAETQAQAIMLFIMEAMEASLSAPGQSSAQVPIVLQMKGELISQVAHLDLATAMDQVVTELRRDALSRLAATLDMPKPVAEGTQAESNHWTAWQVSEDTFQVFIEPLLERLGDAVTQEWYRPVLAAMGVADPERYVLAWDTSSIVQRPGETEDMNWLYERNLISADYRRSVSGVPEDAIPSEDETRRREIMSLVEGAPTLLADPRIGEELFGFEIAPAAVSVDPSQATVEAGESAPALDSPEGSGSRPGPPDTEGDVPDGLVAAAELLVFDALSRAGGRLLTREHRGRFASVPKHELHTVIACAAGDGPRLLADSFTFCDRVAATFRVDAETLGTALVGYTSRLLFTGDAHVRGDLRDALRRVAGGEGA
jgi:hypothetical protein